MTRDVLPTFVNEVVSRGAELAIVLDDYQLVNEPGGAQADRSQLNARFTGADRHVVDYLGEEVLASRPPDVLDFLLRTSMLALVVRAAVRRGHRTQGQRGDARLDATRAAPAVAETLTDRELAILRLLPGPLSSLSWPPRLFVTPNNLKTHLRQLPEAQCRLMGPARPA